MRTSKLLNLGSLILVLGVAEAALADEVVAPPAEGVAEATPADEGVTPPAEAVAEAALVDEVMMPPAEGVAEAALVDEVMMPPAEGVAEAAPADAVMTPPAEGVAEAALAPQAEPTTSGAEASSEPAVPEASPSAPAVPTSPAEPWAAESVAPDAMDEAAAPAALDEAEDPDAAQEVTATEIEAAAMEPLAPALGALGYDAQGRPGRIHIVRLGDTLWDISDAYLGTPWVWPSIWQDNQAIENPHLIYPGDRIWITPSEMRRVTAEEAEALLAGEPAAPGEEIIVAPVPLDMAPEVAVVPEEQITHLVSNREMVGLVTAETVEAAASIVSAVPTRIMLSQGDRVWVGLGSDDVEAGDQFTIFRIQEKVYDPETGRMLGYHVHILGWAQVLEPDAETSLAQIKEAVLDIVKGDLLMPRKPILREIAIQPSPDSVSGQISFFPGQRTLAGTMEYVYLNRGTLDGLEVGSPLQVYRKGYRALEKTRGERVEVPDRVVADLLVVKTQPEASVALVRHTEEELALGDHFRGADR
jgi:nucleoid-associated protein YgaU